jgi:hypothetical protein
LEYHHKGQQVDLHQLRNTTDGLRDNLRLKMLKITMIGVTTTPSEVSTRFLILLETSLWSLAVFLRV